jgi:hypothetical protein
MDRTQWEEDDESDMTSTVMSSVMDDSASVSRSEMLDAKYGPVPKKGPQTSKKPRTEAQKAALAKGLTALKERREKMKEIDEYRKAKLTEAERKIEEARKEASQYEKARRQKTKLPPPPAYVTLTDLEATKQELKSELNEIFMGHRAQRITEIREYDDKKKQIRNEKKIERERIFREHEEAKAKDLAAYRAKHGENPAKVQNWEQPSEPKPKAKPVAPAQPLTGHALIDSLFFKK